VVSHSCTRNVPRSGLSSFVYEKFSIVFFDLLESLKMSDAEKECLLDEEESEDELSSDNNESEQEVSEDEEDDGKDEKHQLLKKGNSLLNNNLDTLL